MVVPGFMETQGSSAKTKHDWKSPLEYFVEKMGLENLRITQLRLLAAVVWGVVLYLPLYSQRSLSQLRLVLMIHHSMAAVGLDEAILMSWTASEPFVKRVLRPGAVVAPFLRHLLPKKQSYVGAGLYAAFIALAIFQIALQRVSNQDVVFFTILFLCACLFDRGVFHSTRPSDILKFLVATLLPHATLNVYVLLAALYFWSGLFKLRGFFHGFVFPYQFLNFSAISWYFRKLFLDEAYLPRFVCKAFGALGTFAEMAVGLGMLCTNSTIAFYSMLIGCAMHAFIFFFGMGPYRWNLMTLYMLCCCICFHEQDELSVQSLFSTSIGSLLYLGLFGLVIPIIGILQPITLGTYWGGYRMATFHFAGNETYRAMLIRRDAIPLESMEGYAPLLRQRMEKCIKMTDDEDLWTGVLYSDGADIEGVLRRGFKSVSGIDNFEVFDKQYVYVPVTWLNLRGPLLNTKWDESLPVTDRIVELVCETVGQAGFGHEPKLRNGAVLQLVAHVVPWLHGNTKRMDLFDMTASKWSTARWTEQIDLPWLARNLHKMTANPATREPLNA